MRVDKNKLIIFDTTLRDGEQSPGVTLNTEEKVLIAKQLSRLGVDVLEAGFPIASPGDFHAVQRIAQEVGELMEGREKIGKPIVVCGLARANEKDIKTAYEAVKDARCHRIHTFLATSDIHLEHKLKLTREQCLEKAVQAVKYAKSLCEDVEFSPEDAARSDPAFLVQILSAVIEAGALTLNIPDTVGYKTPSEFGNLIKYLIDNTKGSDKVTWSAHCHNDLGLATANTLSGILNGVRQVEVTINGIGERAGNTAMEEVVMNIQTHQNTYSPVYHTINTRLFSSTSRMVSDLSGMVVQPNKAIVGKNAFLHESGIHQDGVLKNKETYEIIRPEDVGVYTTNILLGKHSGRHAIKSRLEEIGYSGSSLTAEQNSEIFVRFKQLADKKKTPITDEDLHAIVADVMSQIISSNLKQGEEQDKQNKEDEEQKEIQQAPSPLLNGDHHRAAAATSGATAKDKVFYQLEHLQVFNGTGILSTATVSLREVSTNQVVTDAALAKSGAVEAIFNAIKRIIGLDTKLKSYNLSATSAGSDSACKATIRLALNKETAPGATQAELDADSVSPATEDQLITFTGIGVDSDVLRASAISYVSAVNRLLSAVHSDSKHLRSSRKDRLINV